MTRSSPSRPEAAGGTELLRDLAATPRPTGSVAIAAARERVASELAALGYSPRAFPFEFSALPGRYGTPLFGAAALGVAGIAGHLGAGGGRFAPLAILLVGAVVLAGAGRWLASSGVLSLGAMREGGVNLEFTMPAARAPRVWLCAHLDTKSQPVPTLVRAGGILLTAIGFLGTLALALAAAAGIATTRTPWVAAALVTLGGALPVMMSVVGIHSPGALDNASGVVAVVQAARQLASPDVGVLITDAEELGLAGALAWAEMPHVRRDAIVLNCDGVDDQGANVVMFSRPAPEGLIAAAERAGARRRRMPLGLLTDSVAFTGAGLASVTFSRGSLASLARVHSARDDLSRLRGTGIAPVASLMAATANQLR
ncbi:MAG TPA: M28 family peptidase [Gemmatimonadaceae bacterium]|nr:M28 family peptidase [Gemmatimonadaceae bacterium]